VLEGADQLIDGPAAEGVHPVRPVHCHDGALLLDGVADVGELIQSHVSLLGSVTGAAMLTLGAAVAKVLRWQPPSTA